MKFSILRYDLLHARQRVLLEAAISFQRNHRDSQHTDRYRLEEPLLYVILTAQVLVTFEK